jgi:hypothetical protein
MIIIFIIAEKFTSSTLHGRFSQNTSKKNTACLRVTATKLIFVPPNKEQPHHTQTNGLTGLHAV